VEKREVRRILLAIKETAGDVLICTGILPALKKKWPKADIFFATDEKYAEILEYNPYIAKVLPYHASMIQYRAFETWGPQENTFDIVYHPSVVTQHIPMWIHGGHGDYLGYVYARLCDIDSPDYGPQFLADEPAPELNLPEGGSYVTVHAKTNQDPKDYDHMQVVVDKLKGYQTVQIGVENDPPLKGVSLDLRGKTTPQKLAWVLKHARMHLGLDSFPMHVATLMDTPSVILFGGTYAKQGLYPAKEGLVHAIEPDDRFMCFTSCHLVECEMKKRGVDKCINNITVDRVLDEIVEVIGPGCVEREEPIKLSAYMILKDGIKYGFPFVQSIKAAAEVCDEVVVVDGGSTDDTMQVLREIADQYIIPNENPGVMVDAPKYKVRIFETEWDMDNPTLFGDEKTFARQHCTGNFLLQLDADEFIHEPHPGALRELVEKHRAAKVLDLPVVNFYGNDTTVRVEKMSWKWRLSQNDPDIIHGVYAQARAQDDLGRLVMDKRVSDGCEYVSAKTFMVIRHKPVFKLEYDVNHQTALRDKGKALEKYARYLEQYVKEQPVVFHYSWFDLARKQSNGEFWDATWHGKQKATHNTTEDIKSRIKINEEEGGDIFIQINIDHPMKERDVK